jgi:hypothetical protein
MYDVLQRLSHSKLHTNMGVGLASVCLGLTLAGCASTGAPGAVRIRKDTPTQSRQALNISSIGTFDENGTFSLPEDYLPIRLLAADEAVGGVWMQDATSPTAKGAADSRVWHLASGEAESWSVGNTTEMLNAGAAAPVLTACGSTAWFGINDQLVELAASVGVVAKRRIPETPVDKTYNARVPDGLVGVSGIRAISCNGNNIGIAIRNSSAALFYDAKTEVFTPIPLPADSEAVAVAVAPDGTAAFGLQDDNGSGPHQVLLAVPGQSKTRIVQVNDSASIRPLAVEEGAAFSVGISGERLTVVSDQAAGSVGAGISLLESPTIDPSNSNVVDLQDGRMVVSDGQGLLIAGPTDEPLRHLALGTVRCRVPTSPYGPGGPDTTKVGESTVQNCPVTADALVLSGQGVLWYVPLNTREVKSVPTSSLP